MPLGVSQRGGRASKLQKPCQAAHCILPRLIATRGTVADVYVCTRTHMHTYTYACICIRTHVYMCAYAYIRHRAPRRDEAWKNATRCLAGFL